MSLLRQESEGKRYVGNLSKGKKKSINIYRVHGTEGILKIHRIYQMIDKYIMEYIRVLLKMLNDSN